MEENKRRRAVNHVIIFTSDAENADVKQVRLKTWLVILIVIIISVLVGALIGYFYFEARQWKIAMKESVQRAERETKQLDDLRAELQAEKDKESELEDKIHSLEEEKSIISESANQTTLEKEAIQKELDQFYIPQSFPLNGSASKMEEIAGEGENIVLRLVSSAGVMVVATAKGKVVAVNDDLEYGHNVWVDHENGYITIYRNQGNPLVKTGDIVFPGTALFLMERRNTTLGYQIMLNGEYVNPTKILDVKG